MTPTLIACAHGTNSTEGRRAIRTLVDQVRALAPGVRVVEAFVDVQEPALDGVVDDWSDRGGVVVVPLLLSTGFHTQVDIARAVGAHPGRAVATRALGPHEALADVLESRVRAEGFSAGDAVVLAAAGSSDPAAAVDVAAQAELLAVRLDCRVEVGFAAGRGRRIAAAVANARHGGASRVIAASYVLAPGFFAEVIARAGADVVTAPLAPDERLAGIVVSRFRTASAALPVPA